MTKHPGRRPDRTTPARRDRQSTPAMAGSSAAYNNTISGYASVLGGRTNTASGSAGTIAGGFSNTTSAVLPTSAAAAQTTPAQAPLNVNTSCTNSTFTGFFASVLGGAATVASGQNPPATGGEKNTASAINTSITGGYGNKATGRWDSVTGGYENIAGITEESNAFHGANSISGGAFNEATGPGQSWIGSGEYGKASGSHSAIVGGYKGTVSGTNATIGGGAEGAASGEDAAVSGGSKTPPRRPTRWRRKRHRCCQSRTGRPQAGAEIPQVRRQRRRRQADGPDRRGQPAGHVGRNPQRSNPEGTGNIVIGENEEIEARTGEWEGDPGRSEQADRLGQPDHRRRTALQQLLLAARRLSEHRLGAQQRRARPQKHGLRVAVVRQRRR